jgi:hypothetical protein
MNESRPTHTVEESMIWRNGRNNGIQQERERIIKLLEELAVDEDGCFSERMPETLIALIKGETK